MRRRSFLTLGIAGAATLAAAGWWGVVRNRADRSTALQGDARTIVAAIVPAMLDGALPSRGFDRTSAIAETVANVDRAIQGLPGFAQAELGQLFSLLAIAPARRAFAGVARPWPEASIDEIAAFLDRWRDSGWALKRSAYDALHQLVMASWYGNPRAWERIGYPGPPSIG